MTRAFGLVDGLAAPIFAARAATASFGVGSNPARLNLKISAVRALPSAARSNREHAVLGSGRARQEQWRDR